MKGRYNVGGEAKSSFKDIGSTRVGLISVVPVEDWEGMLYEVKLESSAMSIEAKKYCMKETREIKDVIKQEWTHMLGIPMRESEVTDELETLEIVEGDGRLTE